MKMKYVYILLVIVVVALIVLAKNNSTQQSTDPAVLGALDTFAQCLGDAGATFYGAYWCPHCQEQKRMFENSTKLPYVECSTPDGNAQTAICIEKGIESYPTWILEDGTRLGGVQQLDTLAESTGCELPQS